MNQELGGDSEETIQDKPPKIDQTRRKKKEIPEDVKWILDLEAIRNPEKLRAARVLAIIARFQPISFSDLWRLSGLSKATFNKVLDGLRDDLDYSKDEKSKLHIKPVLYSLKDEKRTGAINKMGTVIHDFDFVLSKIEKIGESKRSAIGYPQVGFYMYLIDVYLALIASQKIIFMLEDNNVERQYVYDNLFHFGVRHADYILTKIREKMTKEDFGHALDHYGELLNIFYADKLLHDFAELLKSTLEIEKDEKLSQTFYGHIANAVSRGTSSAFTGYENKNVRQVIKILERESKKLRARRFRFEKNVNQHVTNLQKIRFA